MARIGQQREVKYILDSLGLAVISCFLECIGYTHL